MRRNLVFLAAIWPEDFVRYEKSKLFKVHVHQVDLGTRCSGFFVRITPRVNPIGLTGWPVLLVITWWIGTACSTRTRVDQV